jgi:hypothetical protein
MKSPDRYAILRQFYTHSFPPGNREQDMFQDSEIINFISALVSVLIILLISRKKEMPKFRFIYPGFFLVVSGCVFTLLEGLFWYKTFNLLEHLSYGAAGILFAAGAWSMRNSPATAEEKR